MRDGGCVSRRHRNAGEVVLPSASRKREGRTRCYDCVEQEVLFHGLYSFIHFGNERRVRKVRAHGRHSEQAGAEKALLAGYLPIWPLWEGVPCAGLKEAVISRAS